jgi:long-chain acyl-CoA synthetase
MNIARYLERSAALIRLGLRPGDIIGLCAPNSPEWLAFYLGTLKAVAVTLYGLLTGDDLVLLVNHPKPRFMFTNAAKLGALFAFEWNSKKKG